MNIIPFGNIREEVNKTSWIADFKKAGSILEKRENTGKISKTDEKFLNNFITCMHNSHTMLVRRPEIAAYLKVRMLLAEQDMTPEDIDFAAYGNAMLSINGSKLPSEYNGVDYDQIKTFGYVPGFTKIVSNAPYTHIDFADGTSVCVKCEDEDTFDADKGIYIALLKKAIGGKNLRHLFKLIDGITASSASDAAEQESVSVDDWTDRPVPETSAS